MHSRMGMVRRRTLSRAVVFISGDNSGHVSTKGSEKQRLHKSL